jgi:hypothetical protein
MGCASDSRFCLSVVEAYEQKRAVVRWLSTSMGETKPCRNNRTSDAEPRTKSLARGISYTIVYIRA